MQDKAMWVQTQWTNLWSRMSVHQLRELLDNSHTNSSLRGIRSLHTLLPGRYQSLLIGEEVEIRKDSEGSDINTESSSGSESNETDDHF